MKIFFLMFSISLFGATPDEQDRFRDIAGKLRCPTCTGLSVLDSDAPFSVQIQNLVKEQMNEGKTEEQIVEYFTTRYGPWILREPPKKGFDIFAWLFPLFLMTLGPIIVWWSVWRKPRVDGIRLRSSADLLREFEDRLQQRRGSL